MMTAAPLGLVVLVATMTVLPAGRAPRQAAGTPAQVSSLTVAAVRPPELVPAERTAAMERAAHAARLAAALPSQPAPTIVCGMTVIIPDPSIDPHIVVPTPEDRGQFSIRRIAPPACSNQQPRGY